jgi:iron complex outermembrane recepter protein
MKAESSAGGTPKHQFQLRSSFRLRRNLDCDASLYFVGLLAGDSIPSYYRLDRRLGWRFSERAELSIAGQNLPGPVHPCELDHTLVERGVVGKLMWRF